MVAKKRSREADSLEGGVMEVRQKVSAKKGGDVPSKAKGKKLQAASQQTSSSTKDLLFSLPPELLNIILDFVCSDQDDSRVSADINAPLHHRSLILSPRMHYAGLASNYIPS
jgi:hypothetical protein